MGQCTAETSHPCLIYRDQGCLSKEALCWVQHCRLEAIIGDALMALHYPGARASKYTKGTQVVSGVSIRRLCASNMVCNLFTQEKQQVDQLPRQSFSSTSHLSPSIGPHSVISTQNPLQSHRQFSPQPHAPLIRGKHVRNPPPCGTPFQSPGQDGPARLSIDSRHGSSGTCTHGRRAPSPQDGARDACPSRLGRNESCAGANSYS